MSIFSPFKRWFSAMGKTLSDKERKVIVVLLALSIAGAIWAVVIYVNSHTQLIPTEGGTYREGIVGQPRYITPVLAKTNDVDMGLTNLIYSGLMKLDENGELTGDLAESVDVSSDGKVYTAHLRKNIKWHDGEPFTANDVVYTIQTIQNPDTKSPASPNFQGVTVQKVDDLTVTFALDTPYAPFMYNLTSGIIPEHVWSQVEAKNISLAEQNLKPIGTGPFEFKKLKKSSLGEVREYNLKKFEDYHGQRPYLDGINFTFYDQNEDLVRAFRSRKVDGMSFVPTDLVEDVAKMGGTTVYRVNIPQYFAVFFNQTKNPILADKVVRTALDLATDRDKLIKEALNGEGIRIDTPIPPGFLGYVENLGKVDFNLEKAKQNLEEAGWKDSDGDGIREKDGKKLEFTLVTTDYDDYVKTAEILVDTWKQIGVKVNLDSKTVGTVQVEAIRPREYDALLYGEVLLADPDPYPFWHSTQTRDPGLNLALFKDRDSDKLLETARKTTDNDARRETYRQFQERLIEQVPAIFLYSPLYSYALHNNVHGTMLKAIPLPAYRFSTISTWHVKTKRIWK